MAKLNMAYLSSLKNRAKTAPSRVLRAPGTSSYHLVPKHLRATWPRPEQSHLLPEACSPNGTDNRQQRQRQTERPPPEPSDILKRFLALYDDKLRYYMKKVSKLYCCYNPLRDMGHICPLAFSSNFQKNSTVKRVKNKIKHFYPDPPKPPYYPSHEILSELHIQTTVSESTGIIASNVINSKFCDVT